MASSGSSGSSSSGSGSSSSGSSGSGSGSGSTGSGSSGGGTDIASLNAGLKSLQKNGKADLKLSAATAKKYTDAVDEFHDTLNLNLQGITSLKSLGSPGSLNSAIETKNNLELDINGLDGVVDSVNQYLDYLTQFKATVTAASKRLIDSG